METEIKNFVIQLGNADYGYYVRHTGDGWLDTTLNIHDAHKMTERVAKDHLGYLANQAQYCFRADLGEVVSVPAIVPSGRYNDILQEA